MKRRVIAVAMMVTLAGCASEVEPAPAGPPDGRALFEQTVLGGQAGCVTCHSREPDRVLVGPSVAGVGSRAADQIPGTSAADYLHESIVDPDAHVVDGFEAGRMPAVWGEVLSPEQIDALVDYLESLT